MMLKIDNEWIRPDSIDFLGTEKSGYQYEKVVYVRGIRKPIDDELYEVLDKYFSTRTFQDIKDVV